MRISRREFVFGGAALAGGTLLAGAGAMNSMDAKSPPGQVKKAARLAGETPEAAPAPVQSSNPTATASTAPPTATAVPPTATPTDVPAAPTASSDAIKPAPTATPATYTASEPVSRVVSPAGLARALDTDFGNSGPQGQLWFDRARAAGYEGFITTAHTFWGGNTQKWWATTSVLERALAAGMWIGAYGRPVTHWREALDNIAPAVRRHLKFFALDVEPEPAGTYQVTRAMVDGVRSYGVRPVIYTGWGMWGTVMGPDSSFSDVPLWDFAGDRAGWPESLWDAPIRAYGGWNGSEATLRVGQQLRMQTEVLFEGVYVDEDSFSRAFIG